MKRLVLIEIPGLSRQQVLDHAPRLRALGEGGFLGALRPAHPSLTLPAHGTIATGLPPEEHGLVANGFYDRAHDEVFMWRQSEGLLSGETIWDAGRARDPGFTSFKHFWWPGMATRADIGVNVRPVYYADGRKGPGVYANVPGLADELQGRFGTFPLFRFWGPAVDASATRWIVDTAKHVFDTRKPTVSLVYLPHLDYRQQSHGPEDPSIPGEIAALDEMAGDLVDHVRNAGADALVVSSYVISSVHTPIHINRLLREKGWLQVVTNEAGERIDTGASRAFAVADHQIANVYLRGLDAVEVAAVSAFLAEQPGVDSVSPGRHSREGDVVLRAAPGHWFTYCYWLDEARAPDFARTVAIHAKPGYDPCELIMNPDLSAPKARLGLKLIRKKLGFRTMMDFIPTDAGLVRGSHGLPTPETPPVCLATWPLGEGSEPEGISMTGLKDLVLDRVFG